MSIVLAPDRRPPGTYSRGEETRRRIIAAAMEMFAERGYEGASTRSLAESAGVNLPAIQYYFGSKEGLYGAVGEHIVERIAEGMAPVAARIAAALAKDDVPRAALRALLFELLDAFLVLNLDDPGRARQFFFRAQVEYATAAFEPIREAMRRYVTAPCAALVARLTNRAEDDLTMTRALLILGQVTIFSFRGPRHEIGWGHHDEERLNALRELVREHTAAILSAARRARR